MAFDVNAFLVDRPAAAPPPPGGFDIDAFLGAPAAAEEKPEPSLLESGARGVKQGLTFGFGDELTGALESAFSDKTYRQARDEARANDKAASEAHPWGYGIGEVLGGLAVPVPGAGALAGGARVGASLGARFAAHAAAGAGAGILSGVGNSEAEDVAGITKDAARSGLAGAALGGILGTGAERLVHGAEGRADNALLSAIGDKATKTVRDKMAGKAEDIIAAARTHGLDRVAEKAPELAEQAAKAKDAVGGRIGELYKAVDAKAPGVELDKVVAALERLEKDYRGNPATRPLAEAVAKRIEDVSATWGKAEGAVAKVKPGTRMATPEELAKVEHMGKPLTAESMVAEDGTEVRMERMRQLFDKKVVTRKGEGRALDQVNKAEPVTVAVSPGGRMEIESGRHRLLVARERGEPLQVRFVRGAKALDEGASVARGQTVPAADVHRYVSELGSAFEGSGLSPGAQKVVQRKAWAAVKPVLEGHVEATLPGKAAELAKLNREYSALSDISKAASYRAKAAAYPTTGLRDIASKGVGAGALAASLATANPLPYLAHAVGVPAAKVAGKVATQALARLARAARAGGVTAKLAQDALTAGVPRATVAAWAPDIAGALSPDATAEE